MGEVTASAVSHRNPVAPNRPGGYPVAGASFTHFAAGDSRPAAAVLARHGRRERGASASRLWRKDAPHAGSVKPGRLISRTTGYPVVSCSAHRSSAIESALEGMPGRSRGHSRPVGLDGQPFATDGRATDRRSSGTGHGAHGVCAGHRVRSASRERQAGSAWLRHGRNPGSLWFLRNSCPSTNPARTHRRGFIDDSPACRRNAYDQHSPAPGQK
jgi:hypothetical protein